MSAPAIGVNAVVIGAGIAGLTTARVLADRFDQVVVFDRDRLPDAPTPRRGTPQAGYPHLMLVSGQRALDELFPGLADELVAAGGSRFEQGSSFFFHRYGAAWPGCRSVWR